MLLHSIQWHFPCSLFPVFGGFPFGLVPCIIPFHSVSFMHLHNGVDIAEYTRHLVIGATPTSEKGFTKLFLIVKRQPRACKCKAGKWQALQRQKSKTSTPHGALWNGTKQNKKMEQYSNGLGTSFGNITVWLCAHTG